MSISRTLCCFQYNITIFDKTLTGIIDAGIIPDICDDLTKIIVISRT